MAEPMKKSIGGDSAIKPCSQHGSKPVYKRIVKADGKVVQPAYSGTQERVPASKGANRI